MLNAYFELTTITEPFAASAMIGFRTIFYYTFLLIALPFVPYFSFLVFCLLDLVPLFHYFLNHFTHTATGHLYM